MHQQKKLMALINVHSNKIMIVSELKSTNKILMKKKLLQFKNCTKNNISIMYVYTTALITTVGSGFVPEMIHYIILILNFLKYHKNCNGATETEKL